MSVCPSPKDWRFYLWFFTEPEIAFYGLIMISMCRRLGFVIIHCDIVAVLLVRMADRSMCDWQFMIEFSCLLTLEGTYRRFHDFVHFAFWVSRSQSLFFEVVEPFLQLLQIEMLELIVKFVELKSS